MADTHEFDLIASPIDPGLTVIEASAGTGKTYTISHLVPRLILTGALPDVSKLLLVTFTNDAARELADRVRRVLTRVALPPEPDEATAHPGVATLRSLLTSPEAEARLQRALLDLDLLAVSTIHAFCQRTLQSEGSLCGVPVMPEVITNDAEYLGPLLQDAWLQRVSGDPVLAAIATSEGWAPGEAAALVDACRRFGPDAVQPVPRAVADLRSELDAQLQPLQDPAAREELTGCLAAATWKAGATAESTRDVFQAAFANGAHTCEFWAGVAFAADIESKLGLRGAAQKTAAAAVLASRWVQAAQQALATARALRWPVQFEIAQQVLPKLSSTLARRRLITQDGLIETLHQALHREGPTGAAQSERLAAHLAAKYHVALIDESQDTDPRQFAIFSRIFLQSAPQRRLILVGDPKQAIYSFRGADVATYLAARDRAERQYTLTRTFRAPELLVDAVNALFARPGAFHNPGMVFRPATSGLGCDRQLLIDGAPCSRLEVWLAEDDHPQLATSGRRVPSLSARVASTIVDLLGRGELREMTQDGAGESRALRCSDFAVLVATHLQATAMADALLERNVPAVVNSGADVFRSEEATELRIVLRAVLEPRRTQRVRAALTTRMLGLTATELVQLDSDLAATDPTSGNAFAAWIERFEAWRHLWETRGLAALFAALEGQGASIGTAATGVAGLDAVSHRLAMVPLTGERRVTNYRQLTDLLLEASQTEASRPAELVRWLGQQIARAEDRCDAEERQLQLSTDRSAVQIVTMHKAKGLEYPLVFCPYLADSVKAPTGLVQLPDEPGRPADRLINLDELDAADQAQRVAQKKTAEMEERLRLAYVALTRAQVRAWTCSYTPSSKSDSDNGSPLDWLLRPAADAEVHLRYGDDWVALARTNRAQRHETALRELGAVAADEPPDAIITFTPPPEPTAACYAGPLAQTATALTALAAPHVPAGWRVTSFSGLTREKHAHGTPSGFSILDSRFSDSRGSPRERREPEEMRTADCGLRTDESLPTADSRGSARESRDSVPPFDVGSSTFDVQCSAAAAAFFGAPAGAAVGTAVHDWIETWDFGAIDSTALRRHLAHARLPAPANGASWETILTELFGTLAQIHLPGAGAVPLAEHCSEAHASEWHFHLPLAQELTVADLARCFAEHAAPEHRDYAPLLASLGEERFHGLLQGFIDRVVRVGEGWGVIDWKTNRLGDAPEDYDTDALLRCALDDHYLLQTHLYLVALRRYLRALGLPDALLTGAWLVFLRGIAAGTPRGVLHINPPPAMLDALDALFAAPALVTS